MKQVAGWDLFLEIVAIVVIFIFGLFVLLSESCEGKAVNSAPPQVSVSAGRGGSKAISPQQMEHGDHRWRTVEAVGEARDHAQLVVEAFDDSID